MNAAPKVQIQNSLEQKQFAAGNGNDGAKPGRRGATRLPAGAGYGDRYPRRNFHWGGRDRQEQRQPGPMSLDDLIREYAANKRQIDNFSSRNRRITEILAARADYATGEDTGRLEGGGYQLIVNRRRQVCWNAGKLEQARTVLGDDLFQRVFKVKYEPHSQKDLDAFLKFADPAFCSMIREAMEAGPASPSIWLERLGANKF